MSENIEPTEAWDIGFLPDANTFCICINEQIFLLTPLQLQDIVFAGQKVLSDVVSFKSQEAIHGFFFPGKKRKKEKLLTEEDKQSAIQEIEKMYKKKLDDENV